MTIPPLRYLPIRFETLQARHNVAPFDCDNPKINDWLRHQALNAKTDEKYATYVAVEQETGSETIVGYVTLRADFILTPAKKKGGYEHVVPAVEIAYLGRDRNWKRLGLGVRLVLQALNVALDVQDEIGGFAGVQLTTTNKGLHLYTGEEFGFEPHPEANSNADFFKTMKDIRALIRPDRQPAD